MGLEILKADVLGDLSHGFFTRKGGASSGVFHGLNCGTGSSDMSDAVEMNRTRVARAMEVDALASVHQVHSATAVPVTASGPVPGQADALVTATPGVALSILTADCQPVLFHDPKAGVIGAAHAGWKGALDGVLEATVAQMEALGARAGDIRAAIGPAISQRAYEVGPEFRDRFLAVAPVTERFFTKGLEGKYHFDLPGYGLSRLHALGLAQAEWTQHCTYSDPGRFYSYRRATHEGEADYGRLISVIRL
jgi:hypothetical protein